MSNAFAVALVYRSKVVAVAVAARKVELLAYFVYDVKVISLGVRVTAANQEQIHAFILQIRKHTTTFF